MRVVMVSNTYLPVVNGVTVSVDAWARALRHAGHEVTIWTVAKTAPELPHVIATRGVGAAASGFPFPTSLRAPNGVLESADVVHIHHPVLLGRIALSASKRRGLPVVATAHSDYLRYLESYAWKASRPALYRAGRGLMRSVFNDCAAVMAPSASIARQLEAWGVTVQISPVDYAIDGIGKPGVDRKEARRRLGLADQPVALYSGRLAPEKGLARLVSEFQQVSTVSPGAVLAIAGDGPYRQQLLDVIAAEGLAGIVRPLGLLTPEQLGLWATAANLYVSASPNEVGPLTAIESQMCATPVVAYRVPGFEDRVESGETGLLAENRTGALAAAMLELFSDTESAARMGAKAESAARTRYDAQRVTRQLLSVYDAVAR